MDAVALQRANEAAERAQLQDGNPLGATDDLPAASPGIDVGSSPVCEGQDQGVEEVDEGVGDTAGAAPTETPVPQLPSLADIVKRGLESAGGDGMKEEGSGEAEKKDEGEEVSA